jgi:SOS-response transcriptional repressor LexA
MSNLDYENKRWLARHLEQLPHGERGRLAKELKITPTKISRMANIDPKASPKNTQIIPLPVLVALSERFHDTPPGLAGIQGRELPPPPSRRAREIVRVPLLDKVAAGKLKSPTSQIPVEDVPLLAFADLGRGEFFALSVEGDSMDRISPEGSIIVVNQVDRTLISGKPYVFSVRGAATFKLWRPDPPRLAPFSTNPMHEPIFVKSKAEAEKLVVGRVKRTVLDL